MHPWGPIIFPLLGKVRGVEGLEIFPCYSQCVCYHVPDVFPIGFSNSQCVLQHVPKTISLCPICFALNPTLVTYITNPKEETTIQCLLV